MGEVARHDHRAGERKPRLDGMPGKRRENFRHGTVEIDRDYFAAEPLAVDVGKVLRGIVLELFEEDAVAGDLAQSLAVGRARHAEPDRQRGTVTRQPDHPYVVTEILAAELRAHAQRLGHL